MIFLGELNTEKALPRIRVNYYNTVIYTPSLLQQRGGRGVSTCDAEDYSSLRPPKTLASADVVPRDPPGSA